MIVAHPHDCGCKSCVEIDRAVKRGELDREAPWPPSHKLASQEKTEEAPDAD